MYNKNYDTTENYWVHDKRIPAVLGLTDLPIEPWCYTEEVFRAMIIDKNDFITEVLKEGITI